MKLWLWKGLGVMTCLSAGITVGCMYLKAGISRHDEWLGTIGVIMLVSIVVVAERIVGFKEQGNGHQGS